MCDLAQNLREEHVHSELATSGLVHTNLGAAKLLPGTLGAHKGQPPYPEPIGLLNFCFQRIPHRVEFAANSGLSNLLSDLLMQATLLVSYMQVWKRPRVVQQQQYM